MSSVDGRINGFGKTTTNTSSKLNDEINTLNRIKRNQENIKNTAATSIDSTKYTSILSDRDRQHILYGDSSGGGHMYPGQPGKTTYPKHWSGEKIEHEVSDIVTSPTTKWYAQTGTGGEYTSKGRPARWVSYEIRDGIRIKTVYEPATGRIVTAFPDNSPKPNLRPIK